MKTRKVFDGQRGLLMSIFVASMFVNLLILTAPLYMLQLFTRVMNSGSMSTLVMLTIGAGIALTFFFLFDMIRQRLVARLGTRIEARLGPTVLDGVLKGYSATDTRGTQPVHDMHEVRRFVISPAFIALLDAPWALAFLLLIYVFHPLLGIVAAIGIAILFALGVISEMTGRDPNEAADAAGHDATRTVEEMLRNAESVRAMGTGRVMVERWTLQSFSAMVFSTIATDRVALMTSLAKLVRMALQIAVLGTGVVLVLGGEISPGVMIAASILLGRAAAPVEQSIAGWRAFLQARLAVRRLNALLATMEEEQDRMELPEPEGHLSVEGATVVVPGQTDPLLMDINFKLNPGQSLGVIGPSGAGKTTLARALVGLQPLVRGHIRLDDASLSDWPTEQLGRYVGFLPQRVELLHGTVAENIAMMDPDAAPSDIVAAAKLAQVHELILNLPGGYNANVGMRGELLSAGQRQRIGLARAFYGDRRVIVLDEPNANLDPEGEEALARAVEAATTQGKIVILITHRMSILRRVSHAAVVQQGRLERFGAAREVLETMVQPLAAQTTEEDGDSKVAMFRRARNEVGAKLKSAAQGESA